MTFLNPLDLLSSPLLIFYVVVVLYCWTLQRSIKAIDKPLRPFPPAVAWICAIPAIQLFALSFMAICIARGYRKMQMNGRLKKKRATGLIAGLCMLLNGLPVFVTGLDTLPYALILMFLWPLHWVQVARLSSTVIPLPNNTVDG